MELVLISAVIGAGIFFGKNNIPRFKDINYLAKVSKNNIPSGDNIYESTRSQEIWHSQRKLAKKIFDKSRDSTNTNYMIAGPPFPIFNKVDATGHTLPIEYSENQTTTFLDADQLKNKSKRIKKNIEKNIYVPKINLPPNDLSIPPEGIDKMATGGWEGIPLRNANEIKNNSNSLGLGNEMSLTGEPLNVENFKHNNMVPFFGGTVRQNVDEYANSALLENFTGNDENYLQKKEVNQNDFFKPVANLTNPYGSSNLDGYNYDRYIVSNRRANQAPVEKIRVGPGLNKGYTNLPSGGFQQENTRDFVLPKTVDELRVKTNPKVSYQGQIVPGKHIAMPGKVGTVSKNNPDTFYLNSPDRLFTTVGASTGPKQRPDIVMKYTNRKTTELKTRIGSAAPAQTGSQQQMRPGVKKSTRQNYMGTGPRNQQAQGKWDINGPNKQIPNDYGRSSMNARPNMRNSTECKTVVTNVTVPNKLNIAPNNPNLRTTRKTNVIGNNRWSGNFQSTGPQKPKVYDPNDLPRSTIKEQNIDNNRQGNFQSTGPQKPRVYDPNDITRTTIKEQNVNNNRQGNFQSTGPQKPSVYDPNDITRTTIKEQNIDNNRQGNFQSTGPRRPTVYDPNDITRTTIKEQNIDNNRQGNFQSTGPRRPTVYDPNDITRTTIKEQNIDNNRQGNFQSTGPRRPTVYDPNDITRTTIKEQNIDNNRQGNFQSTGPRRPTVYDPNDITRTTIKEQNINNNRQGNFQSTGPQKPRVYDPNDVTRTTIKQQNINNNHQGNFQSTGPQKPRVYDPNDITRTTIKEQNINNKRQGNFQTTGPRKPTVYDPNDGLRSTIKQQTLMQNTIGNVNNQKSGGGYINKKVEAKTTHRQQTSVEYVGDAKHENIGGYQISNVNAKNTARQFTADTEYSGTMGPASEKAPMSYSDVYNATVKSIREDVAKGRKPAVQGPKTNVPKNMVNMKTTKNVDNVNNNLEERGIMSTKVYNSIPQPNSFGETHDKDTLPNEPIANRIDPDLLNPFRENPYTQSLHSFAFP